MSLSKVLEFLSIASNGELSACALGLGIATYFILGRLGLILIGVVGGIILHATWEGDNAEGDNAKDDASIGAETKRQKESNVRIVERLLNRQDMRQKSGTSILEAEAVQESTFVGFRPETAAALNHLVDRVTEDYVR